MMDVIDWLIAIFAWFAIGLISGLVFYWLEKYRSTSNMTDEHVIWFTWLGPFSLFLLAVYVFMLALCMVIVFVTNLIDNWDRNRNRP